MVYQEPSETFLPDVTDSQLDDLIREDGPLARAAERIVNELSEKAPGDNVTSAFDNFAGHA